MFLNPMKHKINRIYQRMMDPRNERIDPSLLAFGFIGWGVLRWYLGM